ncbi:hypothetical protein ACF0H5_019054 [Mactra antiquata]
MKNCFILFVSLFILAFIYTALYTTIQHHVYQNVATIFKYQKEETKSVRASSLPIHKTLSGESSKVSDKWLDKNRENGKEKGSDGRESNVIENIDNENDSSDKADNGSERGSDGRQSNVIENIDNGNDSSDKADNGSERGSDGRQSNVHVIENIDNENDSSDKADNGSERGSDGRQSNVHVMENIDNGNDSSDKADNGKEKGSEGRKSNVIENIDNGNDSSENGKEKGETPTANVKIFKTAKKSTGVNELNVPIASKQGNNKETTAVILLTYMRSGSSLTGDILQKSPDIFYIYEPLHKADFIHRRGDTIHFINGSSLLHGQYDLQHVYEETLYGWLTCDLSRVYAQSFFDKGFLSYAHNFQGYLTCIRGVKYGTLMTRGVLYESKQFMDCLKKLEQTCKSSKVKLVKTIRTRGAIAQSVFKRIPNSKILHLIRDPRATIESQKYRNVCNRGMTLCIAEHCNRVRKDTLILQRMRSYTSNRISNVFYEDIASKPITTVKHVYSFIGIDYTDTVAKYAYKLTLGKNTDGCKVCQQRWQNGKASRSSITHIAAWKSGLPGVFINQTQVLCKDIIKRCNYEYYMAPPARKTHK